jgi:plasmid stabilization system protein ParE
LRQHIESIPDFPYKFRKSKWFNDERVRDMIFKGYTIPYYVQDDKIVILDIFKWDK